MNATAYRLAAALVLGTNAPTLCSAGENKLHFAVARGIGGYGFGTLPDLIEPACNPHHRRFFHGLLFAGVLTYGPVRLYQWETEDDAERLLRVLGLLAGGAYLIHLAMDATTKRSLPVVGGLS